MTTNQQVTKIEALESHGQPRITTFFISPQISEAEWRIMTERGNALSNADKDIGQLPDKMAEKISLLADVVEICGTKGSLINYNSGGTVTHQCHTLIMYLGNAISKIREQKEFTVAAN